MVKGRMHLSVAESQKLAKVSLCSGKAKADTSVMYPIPIDGYVGTGALARLRYCAWAVREPRDGGK